LSNPSDSKKPHELLTNREFEIFKLLASGKTVSHIAESLSLALTTVSTYRGRIMEKLDLSTNSRSHQCMPSTII
jgi:DNA-binding NarL/FixJ family response regulator